MTETTRCENLVAAIAAAYGQDPLLVTPHTRTIDAIAKAVLLMCEVSKRRHVRYANEPWINFASYYHTSHAFNHSRNAHYSLINEQPKDWLDEDNLPHAAHAMLRLAFAISRYEEEHDGEAK